MTDFARLNLTLTQSDKKGGIASGTGSRGCPDCSGKISTSCYFVICSK